MRWIEVTEVFSRALLICLEYLFCAEAVAPKDTTASIPNSSIICPAAPLVYTCGVPKIIKYCDESNLGFCILT